MPARSGSPAAASPSTNGHAPIDFAVLHHELQTHKHVTLQLLWEEYLQSYPDGYRYSQFCELYRQWRRKLDVVLRQDHRAGSIQIGDRFWPYRRNGVALPNEEERRYVEEVKRLFLERRCVQSSFTAADEKLARSLHRRGVSLMQVALFRARECGIQHPQRLRAVE